MNCYQCDQIGWTLGNFSKPLATINLPISPTFLGNFCKGVKILNFSSEIIFGLLLYTFGDFRLVTLIATVRQKQESVTLKENNKRPKMELFH